MLLCTAAVFLVVYLWGMRSFPIFGPRYLFFFFLVRVSTLVQCRNPTDEGFAFLLWTRETSSDSQGAEIGNSSAKESPVRRSAGYQQAGPHQQGEPWASSESPPDIFCRSLS